MGLRPVCPAAEVLEGPPALGPSVLCGVIRKDRDAAPLFREADVGVLVTAAKDPSTLNFCCGTALAAVTDEQLEMGRANYTACPVFQAEKKRLWEARRSIDVSPEEDDDDG